uniref:Uncharacterized protein n=1 Tax=Clytia hemisphaerica TaxID=252671 RepID=A0A7M5UU14_9CNID
SDGADIKFSNSNIKFSNSKSLITVEYDNNVTLMWDLYDIERNTIIALYFDNKNNEIGSLRISSISKNYTDWTLDLEKPLSTRIKDFKMVLNKGNGTLKFTIEDLKYDDSGVLIVTNELAKLKAQHNLTLNVEGGPHECGVKSLPQNITCSHDQVITQKVTLCGKPQPAVTWKIGDKEINGTVDKTETDKHQYTYTLKTKLMSDMCGRELSYVANGYHRKRTASSMILMKDCKFHFFTTFTFNPYHTLLVLFEKFGVIWIFHCSTEPDDDVDGLVAWEITLIALAVLFVVVALSVFAYFKYRAHSQTRDTAATNNETRSLNSEKV